MSQRTHERRTAAEIEQERQEEHGRRSGLEVLLTMIVNLEEGEEIRLRPSKEWGSDVFPAIEILIDRPDPARPTDRALERHVSYTVRVERMLKASGHEMAHLLASMLRRLRGPDVGPWTPGA